ncbi:hypothetical protein [Methylosinus sp. Ce-a6]|uniref:hypothetical protein n=1 Tax=Methylosinus sp. Ce-a6 TaxID=2172005 RepID=UPI00135C3B86|nr:hypothetical protein [Methylosinus sp. Ce-a6]
MIARVSSDIAYVAERRLERPILIRPQPRHLHRAADRRRASGAFGGLVTLDGYPVSALTDAEPRARGAAAQRLAEQFSAGVGTIRRDFQATLRGFLAARMNDPWQAERFAERAARSDPTAIADFVVEMLSADRRSELSRLAASLLALAATDSYLSGRAEDDIRAFYAGLLADAPTPTVAPLRGARHFVAVEQPDVATAAIESFAAGLRLGHCRVCPAGHSPRKSRDLVRTNRRLGLRCITWSVTRKPKAESHSGLLGARGG